MFLFRYGLLNQVVPIARWNHVSTSSGWRHLCCGKNVPSLWFSLGVARKVRSGKHVKFWHDIWVLSSILKNLFPRLYLISEDKYSYIADMGEWCNEVSVGSGGGEGIRLCGTKIYCLNCLI